MTKINFFIASERHARDFAPVIKQLDQASVYRYGTPRAAQIDAVLKEYGLADIETNSLNRLFANVIDRPEVFVCPLQVGTVTHGALKAVERFNHFLVSKLSLTAGRLGIINEKLYTTHEGYKAHAHFLLARSEVELEQLKTHDIKDTYLVGDSSIQIGSSYKKGKRLLFLISDDPSRAKSAPQLIESILKDLEAGVKAKTFIPSEVIIKHHPGGGHKGNKDKVWAFCTKYGIPVREVSKWECIENIVPQVDVAIVQSSLSSHFVLRGLGVESFIYSSSKENNDDLLLTQRLKMPACQWPDFLSKKYNAVEYNKWIANAFLAETAVERFVNALKDQGSRCSS